MKIKISRSILIITGFSLLGVLILGASFKPTKFEPDHREYFAYAYNLYQHGIYALERNKPTPPAPSAIREPGYPFLLYGILNLFPGKICDQIAGTVNIPTDCHPVLYFEFWCQSLLLFLLCVLTAYFILLYTDNLFISLLFVLFILLDVKRCFTIKPGSPEMLARFLMFFTCAFIYLSLKYLKLVLCFLSGVFMGLLALTKAIFGYLIWPFSIFFLLTLWAKRKDLDLLDNRKTILTGFKWCAIIILGFYLIVFPWLWRNHQLCGKYIISDRAAEVLGIRAAYNQMNAKEYLTSFLWFTPLDAAQSFVKNKFPPDWYQNLDRDNQDGYYRSAKSRYSRFHKNHPEEDVESQYKEMIVSEIASQPFKHLMVTVPMAYQGIYFSTFGLFIFSAFILAFYRWIIFKDWMKILALFPAIYCFGMYAFFSHNIPRYNVPISTVGMVLMAVVSFDLYEQHRQRKITIPK
jgi:4-amino-4-deoxy-L-arabinose transferase-like glycosyltransferase